MQDAIIACQFRWGSHSPDPSLSDETKCDKYDLAQLTTNLRWSKRLGKNTMDFVYIFSVIVLGSCLVFNNIQFSLNCAFNKSELLSPKNCNHLTKWGHRAPCHSQPIDADFRLVSKPVFRDLSQIFGCKIKRRVCGWTCKYPKKLESKNTLMVWKEYSGQSYCFWHHTFVVWI